MVGKKILTSQFVWAEPGSIVSTNAFAGVHRGATGGRTPGRALGYSQIVNPIYLVRKGTMSAAYATKLMTKNLIANHVRALRPEPHVDRLGRARGNWLGIVDVLRRKDRPEKFSTYECGLDADRFEQDRTGPYIAVGIEMVAPRKHADDVLRQIGRQMQTPDRPREGREL